MNCVEFEKNVIDLARSEPQGVALDVATAHRSLSHAQSCVRCARRLKTEQSVSRSLRAVAVEDQLLGAPPALEASLLAAFRAREIAVPMATNVIVPTFQESPLKMFFARLKWALAPVAVTALIALLAFAIFRAKQPATLDPATSDQSSIASGKASPSATPDVVFAAPEQLELPGPQPIEEAPQGQMARFETPRLRVPARQISNQVETNRRTDRVTVDVGEFVVDEPEAVSTKDFLVFDYAQTLPPADSVQLMRVRMPRERLAPLGIPLPREARNENFVNADFLVGSDGVPRAIRVADR